MKDTIVGVKLYTFLSFEKDTTLSFDTWHRIESNYDYGFVEVSSDGENWNTVTEPFTGSSVDWNSKEIQIPASTTHIRFRYDTDAYTNGRGWYVTNVELEGQQLDLFSDEWIKRDY
ncbi:hypothetical protein ACFQ3N_15190 [Virgibacillus byunsanensis]|uniref:F5/8 type C domain-containing protein n=1 Tax=Virgibacillus byunsanensis TaxID=570945 RepID=A0ABW3LQU9_9BACI